MPTLCRVHYMRLSEQCTEDLLLDGRTKLELWESALTYLQGNDQKFIKNVLQHVEILQHIEKMYCEFAHQKKNIWICVKCGGTIKSDKMPTSGLRMCIPKQNVERSKLLCFQLYAFSNNEVVALNSFYIYNDCMKEIIIVLLGKETRNNEKLNFRDIDKEMFLTMAKELGINELSSWLSNHDKEEIFIDEKNVNVIKEDLLKKS